MKTFRFASFFGRSRSYGRCFDVARQGRIVGPRISSSFTPCLHGKPAVARGPGIGIQRGKIVAVADDPVIERNRGHCHKSDHAGENLWIPGFGHCHIHFSTEQSVLAGEPGSAKDPSNIQKRCANLPPNIRRHWDPRRGAADGITHVRSPRALRQEILDDSSQSPGFPRRL